MLCNEHRKIRRSETQRKVSKQTLRESIQICLWLYKLSSPWCKANMQKICEEFSIKFQQREFIKWKFFLVHGCELNTGKSSFGTVQKLHKTSMLEIEKVEQFEITSAFEGILNIMRTISGDYIFVGHYTKYPETCNINFTSTNAFWKLLQASSF